MPPTRPAASNAVHQHSECQNLIVRVAHSSHWAGGGWKQHTDDLRLLVAKPAGSGPLGGLH